MGEDLLSMLLTMAGPLLGVLLGGLITFLTMSGVERQRWRHERREKFLGLKRDALAASLEWIEPMRNAETRASSLVMSAIRGEIDDEHFLNEFPHLLGDLVRKDLAASQRAVLPDNIHARGLRIVRELDELRFLGAKYCQEARVRSKPMVGFQECSAKLDTIGQQITALDTDLRKAFRGTFDQE
ncbi:MAG TPA: hypothetical protein ENN80_02130 [Candidatus Hydrogenedentes bacterium]|nr:hypothetical protein [Candidatus Hydrogenedentota bacterium]